MERSLRPPYGDPFNWLVRNRQTGRITLVQRPNLPLLVFMVATGLKLALRPHGRTALVIGVVATTSIVVWAVTEVFRGVNPFRRILGGIVLASQLASLLPR